MEIHGFDVQLRLSHELLPFRHYATEFRFRGKLTKLVHEEAEKLMYEWSYLDEVRRRIADEICREIAKLFISDEVCEIESCKLEYKPETDVVRYYIKLSTDVCLKGGIKLSALGRNPRLTVFRVLEMTCRRPPEAVIAEKILQVGSVCRLELDGEAWFTLCIVKSSSSYVKNMGEFSLELAALVLDVDFSQAKTLGECAAKAREHVRDVRMLLRGLLRDADTLRRLLGLKTRYRLGSHDLAYAVANIEDAEAEVDFLNWDAAKQVGRHIGDLARKLNDKICELTLSLREVVAKLNPKTITIRQVCEKLEDYLAKL